MAYRAKLFTNLIFRRFHDGFSVTARTIYNSKALPAGPGLLDSNTGPRVPEGITVDTPDIADIAYVQLGIDFTVDFTSGGFRHGNSSH
jgi:phage tail protein X